MPREPPVTTATCPARSGVDHGFGRERVGHAGTPFAVSRAQTSAFMAAAVTQRFLLLLFIQTIRLSKGRRWILSREMSPRPYNLGKRQDLIGQGRRQILDATRALLGEFSSYTAFTVEAVARRADVARATVYYQFGSKSGRLEALFDALS